MASLSKRQKRSVRAFAAALDTPALLLVLFDVIDFFDFLVISLFVLCGSFV